MSDQKRTNIDIPGDKTPQPAYMSLNKKQKDEVDRAVYGTLIQGNSDFTKDELSAMKSRSASIFAPPGVKFTPNSSQVEMEIESLRERYAAMVLKPTPANTEMLQAKTRNAPGAEEARRGLNAIIKFNGDECGCGGIAMTSQVLSGIITAAKKTGPVR